MVWRFRHGLAGSSEDIRAMGCSRISTSKSLMADWQKVLMVALVVVLMPFGEMMHQWFILMQLLWTSTPENFQTPWFI
jgi:hypothetical protein